MGTPLELVQLAKLMARAVASPYSDFYRTLYNVPAGSVPNLASWDDWQLVPTFTKENLLESPMREYTFVPHSEVEVIYYTSGTSGKPPAFFPWPVYAGNYAHRKMFYDFKGAVLSSIKAQHRNDVFLKEVGSPFFAVNFDGKHPQACVRLAKTAGVTMLGVHTFTIQAIGEEMKKVGMNKDIKLIDFVGETCSLMLYSYMRETFPNAKIISFYGMSEVNGTVGRPCRAMSDDEPYPVFHVDEEYHVDLIDPVSGLPLPALSGTEAEVLITDRSDKVRGFPVIRYRIGDTVRVVEERCKEHGAWTFTVLGKTASDFMLVPGGQLRADEIERVLRSMQGEVTDHFEMHRYDAGTKERPMLEAVLHVQTLDPNANLDTLAKNIQKELRVAPNRTYQKGVEEGYYAPLRCTALAQTTLERKHRRMFKH